MKVFRLALSANVGKIVKTAMGLLGIEVPEHATLLAWIDFDSAVLPKAEYRKTID